MLPERIGVFARLKTSAESISALFTAVLAARMVGLWGYRSIFVVLLVAIVASLAVLATNRVERPTPQVATATPVDVAATAPYSG